MRGLGLLLALLGLGAVAMGNLWIGQGAGYIRWPEVSPMIDVRMWIWWGLGLVILGFGLIATGRWLRRRR